ncbi:UvrD-helicase domain-containing protein [Cellvibrio mixtus]|uniref:UvrD-helicase domain-containing protein n=1 Tax=Cellvibrio mixtus TaxID=39650 RepID=UPI0005873FEF|nr:UvrD-helicase domain-containing protein [Cellvibrio mixtus]
MSIQYFTHNDLREQAHALYKRGGSFKKTAEKVMTIIQLVTSGERNPLSDFKTTNHGEKRLEHCVKYDLPSACRLVTVQNEKKIFLLFVGDHEDEEKWLNANRGNTYKLTTDNKIELVKVVSKTLGNHQYPVPLNYEYSSGQLYQHLSESDYEYLVSGLSRQQCRHIEELNSFSADESFLGIVESVQDELVKSFVLDVLLLLKEGDSDGARKRILLERGELKDLTEEVAYSGELISEIPTDDPTYAELFAHFVKTADYKSWMLFMHPEQRKVVDLDFDGAAKLVGVSGSGKTCVVVKRAIRLAARYKDKKILVVTLNRSLAKLIKELVDVASPVVNNNIEVKPFFTICQEYLLKYEPENHKLYDDVTWKSLEHIDEIWHEFYRCELNNHSASILIPVHDYLIAQGINASEYIRHEFDWIRSAVSFYERNQYLTIDREGRSVPLNKNFREIILEGLSAWEGKMKAIGVTDYIGLATALMKYKDDLYEDYRCVLVDESQDFGTIELALIRKITQKAENDIFVCGDASQRVSTKFQSFRKSGIEVFPSRSKKILKNYRNSKEILKAAQEVLSVNFSSSAVLSEDFEVLSPEYSNFSSSCPLLLKADTLADEISCAVAYSKQQIIDNSNMKVCVAICGYTHLEIQRFGELLEIKVLDSSTSIGASALFFSDLEQTKGFEFDLVIVVNVIDGVMPNFSSPELERTKDLTQLYVSLTRAKRELIVSYHGSLSPFFEKVDEFLEEDWINYLDAESELPVLGCPKQIEELKLADDSSAKNVVFMTGKEFLYTKRAIGLPALLIEKLRENIDGITVNRDGHLVKWKNIGSAYESIKNSPRSRQAFGPEGFKLFSQLCQDLDIEIEMKKFNLRDIYMGEIVN